MGAPGLSGVTGAAIPQPFTLGAQVAQVGLCMSAAHLQFTMVTVEPSLQWQAFTKHQANEPPNPIPSV